MDSDKLGKGKSTGVSRRTLLSDDYLAVADEDLKKLHSVLTVLGGSVVHSGGMQHRA